MNKNLFRSTFPVALILFLVCCIPFNANSQTKDELLRTYNNETIHSFGKTYIKGSKQINFSDLKTEFNSGITKDLYKKAKGNLFLKNVFGLTSLAALITAAVVRKNNSGAAMALSGLGIGLNFGTSHFSKRSAELTDQAIWLRNKEILFGVQ